MTACLLCQENEGQMEFNTPTSQGMLTASICLECWESLGDDAGVALAIVRERQCLAIPKFGLPLDIVEHWGDVPEEQRPEIQAFLLQG